ncbi:unnamed protein product, partial [Hymenolepis diminuta]
TDSRRLKKPNSEQSQVDINENPTDTTRKLSKTFHASRHMSIYGELKKPGKVSKVGKRVSHDLSQINKQQCAICCISLCPREHQSPFLDRIITDSDEKWWILHNNVKRKSQWISQDSGSKPISQPRSDLHTKISFVFMVGFDGGWEVFIMTIIQYI